MVPWADALCTTTGVTQTLLKGITLIYSSSSSPMACRHTARHIECYLGKEEKRRSTNGPNGMKEVFVFVPAFVRVTQLRQRTLTTLIERHVRVARYEHLDARLWVWCINWKAGRRMCT
jgi:hypothetical protein